MTVKQGIRAWNREFPFERSHLPCPALVLDLDVFELNLERMSSVIRGTPIKVRPHAKSHKSIDIARRQLESGATGLCCATLTEAEGFMAAGIQKLLLTSPIVGPANVARAVSLANASPHFMMAVDSLDIVRQFEHVKAKAPISLVVDLDVGQDRTGARSVAAAIELAEAINAGDTMRLAGIQGYAGHLQHLPDSDKKSRDYRKAMRIVTELAAELRVRGLPVERMTGGGTGTLTQDIADGILDEIQAGSFAFMDSQYNAVWETAGVAPPFGTSLFIQAEIISVRDNNRYVINAGYKSMATDAGNAVPARPSASSASFRFRGDEHGEITLHDGGRRLQIGETVELISPHCDPTVNLYRHFWCVRGDLVCDRWPIISGS